MSFTCAALVGAEKARKISMIQPVDMHQPQVWLKSIYPNRQGAKREVRAARRRVQDVPWQLSIHRSTHVHGQFSRHRVLWSFECSNDTLI